MKSASLALACALLGATALAPASFAQTPAGTSPTQNPAEASPSTSSPDASSRTGTSAQRDWRDQEGRIGGWRNRDDDDERFASRDMRGRYGDDEDDDDDDPMAGSRGGYGMGRDTGGGMGRDTGGGMGRDMGGGMGRDMRGGGRMGGPMGQRLSPEIMRMHMRAMGMHGGARLNLKRGDSQINVRCPATENMAACIDAVGKLMDRLQAMPQTR